MKRHQNAAELMVRVAAPEMFGDTHLPRYIANELAQNEAKALRRCSLKLRKEAKKQRAMALGLSASKLDAFANEFLYEAQVIEKGLK